MSPLAPPSVDLEEKHSDIIVKFVSDVRNGKLEGSTNIALATITMLEQIISESTNASAYELSMLIRQAGRSIQRALPQELVAANMTRRALRAIRDECRQQDTQSGESSGDSLQRLVLGATSARRGTIGDMDDLRSPLREHIAELRAEIESSTSSICSMARSHVHGDELILTYGASRLAERFLKAAACRGCRLVVAEGTAGGRSHAMAARLAAAGVPVTVISNAAIYGVMSRVNKVVIGVRALLAGGAALAEAGAQSVALAAKHYCVPLLALAPIIKLSPVHAVEQHQLNSLASPQRALPYECAASGACQSFAPMYDCIPPDHVTLFITNLGASSPSYIYRLLSELYDPKDYQI